jgi:anti-repressor protein
LINVQQLRKQEKARQLELENKLAAQTPVFHAYKRLAATEGSMNITEAAKNLKIPSKELTNYMLDAGWLYTRPPSTRKIAYQTKINQGWMFCHEDKKPLSDGRELFLVHFMVTGVWRSFMDTLLQV